MMNLAPLQKALAQVPIQTDLIRLIGGLDEVTPPYQRPPGRARAAMNFEATIHGGYRRIAGYERVDGRPAPSSATFGKIGVTITGSFSVGNTVTGNTSAATGKVIVVAADHLILTKVSGTFQSGESLKVGGTPQGTSTSTLVVNSASSLELIASYKNLAADEYRSDIGAVPGSGNVIGVFRYGGVTYALRNNAGGTAAEMYKSSAGGWTLVSLGRELRFTAGGTTAIAEGNTITGATSGATAVVTRVVLQSGSWAAGTAVGKLIFASQTGNFVAESIQVGGVNRATIAANSSAITLLPNGKLESKQENFGGSANTKRVYGVDGVNRGFEFDGTVYVPIDTGMTTDNPKHVTVHKNHLFFSFGGSVQHSSPGSPYVWSPVTGASEIGMGDEVAGFAVQPGDTNTAALAIFTRNRLSILYGTGVANWNLVPYRDEIGAYPYTIQDVGYTMFLDDRGITDLQTSQNYGNFAHNAITDQILTTINTLRLSASASCISRDNSQYRLFASNGKAIYVTLKGRTMIGMMPIYFPDPVLCCWSGEDSDGSEVILFGSSSGYVYQMERGTSFDGANISFYLNLAYNFQRSPRIAKHYHDVTLEVSGGSYASFNLGFSLGYGDSDIPQPVSQNVVTNFEAVFWGSFVWGSFTWGGRTLSPNVIAIDGDGENISIGITGNSDIYAPFTITAALLHYSLRARLRP